MALIAPDWNPGSGQLRTFSVVAAVFSGVIGLLAWHHASPESGLTVPGIIWGVGGAVLLLGLVAPKAVKPLYILLMAVSLPIGMVVSWVVLGIMYYLLMTPVGWAMRIGGYDPMHRRLDRTAETYWITMPPPATADRYFRQS